MGLMIRGVGFNVDISTPVDSKHYERILRGSDTGNRQLSSPGDICEDGARNTHCSTAQE